MAMYNLLLLVCNTLLVLEDVTAKPSEPVALYLHTQTRSWNEANQECQKDNQRLVTVKDSTKSQILRGIVDEWSKQNLINSDFWFGLYDTSTNTYSWTDCSPLRSWTSWDDQEPNDKTTDKCNRVEIRSFNWKTMKCRAKYKSICELSLDSCWYDTYPRKTLTGSLLSAGIMNFSGCKNHCLTKDVPDEECAAFTFTGDDECLLLMRNKPFLDNDALPGMEFNTSSVSGIKRCFVYYSTNVDTSYVDSSTLPSFTCPVVPTPPVTPTTLTESSLSSALVCDCDSYRQSCAATPEPSSHVSTEAFTSRDLSTELSTLMSTTQGDPSMSGSSRLLSSASWMSLHSPSAETRLLSTSSWVCPECLCSTTVVFIGDNDTSNSKYTSELILNKTSLSSHRRKLTSAKDARTSSVVIGTVGCANIALFFVILVILDCNNLVELFQSIIHSDRFKKM